MPSYFPEPFEHIMAQREKNPDGFGTDLFMDGLNVNFRRKPWSPLEARQRKQAGLSEPEFVAITQGDPEFDIRNYIADAQVPSAHAETIANDARQKAADYLTKYGHLLDDKTRKNFEAIAGTGFKPKSTNWFTNILNVIDTPGELVRMGIADLFGADEKHGTEIEGRDYLDALLGREDEIRARHGDDLVGDGQFAFEGARLIRAFGGDSDTIQARNGRAVGGFLLDVILDPTTYVSFGTVGLGKKVAMEAAQAGLQKAGREAVEAISRDAVSGLTDSASREIAQRIERRIAGAVEKVSDTPIVRAQARHNVRSRVLAEELRALDAAEGLRVQRRNILDQGLAIEDLSIPAGTVTEEVAKEVLPHLADKQFRTLAEAAPWYMSSNHVAGFAKGGVQFGLPFGRKRFPMLRIAGTETNRLASTLLGRKQVKGLFEKMPAGFQTWMGDLARRTGVEKAVYEQAREGSLWRVQAEQNMTHLLLKEVLPEEAVRPFAQGIKLVENVAEEVGVAREESHKLLRQLLTDNASDLEGLHPKLQTALREAVGGSDEFEGIKHVFETFHDAARRVGLDMGRVENYSPLVVHGSFARFLDRLADSGIDIPIGQGQSDMANIGHAILARYLNNSGESAIGFAGRDLGYTRFAEANKVTSVYRNGYAGVELANDVSVRDLLAQGGIQRLNADVANDAVAAALDELVSRNPGLRKQLQSVEQAFETDMAKTLTAYTSSMGEAVQFRDLIRRLRRVGLVDTGEKVIDVSASLASIKGRMSSDVARFIDDLAEGKGREAASRLVKVKAGGRTFRVPAAVAANPEFKRVASRASRAFSRFDTKGNEIRTAIAVAERRLVGDGWPEEIAQRLAFSEADTSLGEVLADLADIARHEIETIEMGVLEASARGAINSEDGLRAAADEARRIMGGVDETIREMEEQARRALNLPDLPASERSIDLLDPAYAPKGHPNTLAAMARWAIDSREREIGKVTAQALEGPALQGATRQRMAREAVADLADRLIVSNATVGDLAEFGSPRVAGRVLAEANARLLGAGYDGVASLTDEIVDAAESVFAAEYRLFTATDGIEELAEELAAAERVLDGVAESLRGSDELLGDIMDHVVETVEDINDSILMSATWRDVWATAIHKTEGLPRGEFAKNRAEAVAKGLEDLTQKQLTQKGAKGVSREVADEVRGLWAHAAASEDLHLERRSYDFMTEGRNPHRAVLEAMLAGDVEIIAARPREFSQIVASITDKAGRPMFDPQRFVLRETGQLVYEPAAPVWVTLDDVMDSIREVAGNADLSDLEALSIVKQTWDDSAEVVEAVDSKIGEFFRQVDAAGGLPYDVENYEYLRRFTADLEITADELANGRAIKPTAEALTADEDQLARKARSNWNYTAEALRPAVRTLIEGGQVADESLRQRAQALMKWWEFNAETPGNLIRALNQTEIELWSNLKSGDEFFLDMASTDIGGIFAQRARKGSQGQWTMEFAGHTRAARNDLNQIEAAVGGDEWLVSGYFKVSEIDPERQIIKVAPTRDAVLPNVSDLPKVMDPADIKIVKSLLDEVDKAFKLGNARSLTRTWDNVANQVRQALPAEEFSRLTDLVGKAEAVGRVRTSYFGDQLRTLIGSAEDVAEGFAHDVAMLRRQSWDLGETWAESVATDAVAFRNAFKRLMTFADDVEPGVRAGFQPLERAGGEFEQVFGEVTEAATKLRKGVAKAGKERRLAGFLPEIPEDVRSMDRWLKQFEGEMSGWTPIRVTKADKDLIPVELAGLAGDTVDELKATRGVALMLDHMATASIAVSSPLGIRLAAEAYREVESWWKAAATVARPTFVPRNVFSGIVNGLLIGVGPRHYAAVRHNVWRFRQMMDELGVEGAIKALPKDFQPYMDGLWRSGLLGTSFSHTLDRLRTRANPGQLLNPFSSQNALFRAGGTFMESSEDFLRAAAFIRWYDPNNPATLKLAREMALAVHFDYTSLTKMETAIKRFVPFFVWTRRNLPLQMRAMLEQPGSVTRLLHAKENINAEYSDTFVDEVGFTNAEWLSSFAVKTPFIFEEDTPYWQRLMLNPAIPVTDLEEALKALDQGPGAIAEWLLRSLSPAFSTPMSIVEDYDVVAPTGLREIFMAADAILPGEGVAGYEEVLGGNYRGPSYVSNVFSTAFPMLGEWTRIAGIRPSSGSQAARGGFNIEDGITPDERIRAAVLGLGRGAGATLQTPGDTRAEAFEAIFGMEDIIEEEMLKGRIVNMEDLDEVIEAILAREGVDPRVLRAVSR